MSISDSVDIRVKHRMKKNVKDQTITTLKTHIDGKEEARTIKLTVDGHEADLQVKYAKRPTGFEFVHVHCLKDKETSEWSKSFGVPIEHFYQVTQKGTTAWEITCKRCGRTWDTAGSAAPYAS